MLNLKKVLSYSLLATAVVLSGCASKTKPDDQASVPTTPEAYHPGQGSQSAISGVDISASPLPDQGPANISHVVHFAFNSYVVDPQYQSMLQQHANFLLAHQNYTVVLEGNTDDIGGREYNLALGQRRAEAVRQVLELLGVPASRTEAISYGMERPVATGNSDAARAENRRVDIRYKN